MPVDHPQSCRQPVTRAGCRLSFIALIAAVIAGPALGANGLPAIPDPALLAPCIRCHEPAGALEMPDTPWLNGQLVDYLAESIDLLSAGRRATDVPDHIPAAIDSSQVEAIAEYFAGKPRIRLGPPVDLAKAMIGAGVYRERCIHCHIEDGAARDEKGLGAPLLAGQNVLYLIKETRAYLIGTRKFSSDFMRRIFAGEPLILRNVLVRPRIGGLSDEELEGVSHYFSAAQPRPRGRAASR